ncbi:MAG: hypothetical protein ACR2PL_27595, partial [Dehalococcoidia bacterium]
MSPDPFAALSVRLTSSDPEAAEIYQIGAVRWQDGRAVEYFSSSVRTDTPVPYRVRVLAGVESAHLLGAPSPDEVAVNLRRLVRDRPIVLSGGPAVIAALGRFDGVSGTPVFDLSELTELLVPGRETYELHSLARHLGLIPPALQGLEEDAVLSALVFDALRERAAAIDPTLLQEIVRLTAASDWSLRYFFRDVVESLPALFSVPSLGSESSGATTATNESGEWRPLSPLAERRHIDPDEIVRTLECATGESESGLERRPQQLEMAAAVASALDEDSHLIVEAGTGTGKSLGYLLPSACFALRNNARVVVSTNTINLQQQIIGKDIPDLGSLMLRCGPEDIQAQAGSLRSVALKGRRNYLCLQRLFTLRHAQPLGEDESRFVVRVLLWLRLTQTGDRSELRLRPEEETLWHRLSAENTNCFAIRNHFVRSGQCQLLQARKRAEAAHLVVVNHALLLSDIAADGHVLPAYDRLVIDEAHNLEDEATDHFGFNAGQAEVSAFLDAVFSRGREREAGLVIELRTAMHTSQKLQGPAAFVADLLTQLADRVDRARERVPETFGLLRGFVQQQGASAGDYDNRLLLTPAKRAQPDWMQVETGWENLRLALLQVEDGLQRLGVAVSEGGGEGILDSEGLLADIQTQQVNGSLLRRGIEAIVDRHDVERIAWLTVNRANGAIALSSAPLSVGEVLDSYLFSRKASVILTSATLSTSGGFGYVRERLG